MHLTFISRRAGPAAHSRRAAHEQARLEVSVTDVNGVYNLEVCQLLLIDTDDAVAVAGN